MSCIQWLNDAKYNFTQLWQRIFTKAASSMALVHIRLFVDLLILLFGLLSNQTALGQWKVPIIKLFRKSAISAAVNCVFVLPCDDGCPSGFLSLSDPVTLESRCRVLIDEFINKFGELQYISSTTQNKTVNCGRHHKLH